MNLTLIVTLAIVAVAFLLLVSGLRIVHEHERGAVFRFGRYARLDGPGLRLILPLRFERMVRVDARTGLTDLPAQELTTADQTTVRVTASMHSQVLNPQLALTKVADYRDAIVQIAQTALRSVISRVTLNLLLSNRTFVNETVQRIVDDEVEPWGVKVLLLEVKEVQVATPAQAPADTGAQSSAVVVLPVLLEIQAKLARTNGAASALESGSAAPADSSLPPMPST